MANDKMNAAVCEMCGGGLIMQANGSAFECVSCGISYPMDWVKAKVQEISGIVRIDGPVEVTGVVQINDSTSAERIAESAEILVEAKMFGEASETYAKIRKNHPASYHGWWGELRVLSKDFTTLGTYADSNQEQRNTAGLGLQGEDAAKFSAIFKTFSDVCISNYKKVLALTPESDKDKISAAAKKYSLLIEEQIIRELDANKTKSFALFQKQNDLLAQLSQRQIYVDYLKKTCITAQQAAKWAREQGRISEEKSHKFNSNVNKIRLGVGALFAFSALYFVSSVSVNNNGYVAALMLPFVPVVALFTFVGISIYKGRLSAKVNVDKAQASKLVALHNNGWQELSSEMEILKSMEKDLASIEEKLTSTGIFTKEIENNLQRVKNILNM